MHEHHLAENIVRSVEAIIREQGWSKVTRVVLGVRKTSPLTEDILRHGFDELKADSLLPQAELSVEEQPIFFQCKKCGHRFSDEDWAEACPACGGTSLRMEPGEDVFIKSIDHTS